MKAVRWIAVVALSMFVAGCEEAAFNSSDAGSTGNVPGISEATPGETETDPTLSVEP